MCLYCVGLLLCTYLLCLDCIYMCIVSADFVVYMMTIVVLLERDLNLPSGMKHQRRLAIISLFIMRSHIIASLKLHSIYYI